MPAYGKRSGQPQCVGVDQSLAGVASKFADYAVSVLEGREHDYTSDSGCLPTKTPTTALRPGRSALDVLRWNSGASGVSVARRAKRQKTVDSSQLHLDFGQRNFYSTKCAVCDMHYCPGLASDEKLHEEFHKRVTHGIVYKGFKNQHTVRDFSDGSFIVCIRRNDPASHVAKADEVRKMAERELGGYEGSQEASSVTFLMISPERRVVGYLLAERIRRAYRVVIPENSRGENHEGAVGSNFPSTSTTTCPAAGQINRKERDALEPTLLDRDDSSRCTENSPNCGLRGPDDAENGATAGKIRHETLDQESLALEKLAQETSHDAFDDKAMFVGRAEGAIAEGADVTLAASMSPHESCIQEMHTPRSNAAQCESTRASGGGLDGYSDDDLDGLDLDALEAGDLPAALCTTAEDVSGSEKTTKPHDGWKAMLYTSSVGHESLSSSCWASADQGTAQDANCLPQTDCSEHSFEKDAGHICDRSQTDDNRVQNDSSASHFGMDDAALVLGAEAAHEEEVEAGDSDAADEDIEETCDDSLMVSTEEEVAACGICQVWVHRNHRRKGVATRLIEAALECSGFHDGSFAAPYKRCAFSQPTPAGRRFASKFFGTPHFLVYKSTD